MKLGTKIYHLALGTAPKNRRRMLCCVLLLMTMIAWWLDGGQHEVYAFLLIGGFVEGLKPEPVMTVDEWANTRRILNSKGSYESGPYNVNRTPYLRKIMRVASVRSAVQFIIFAKGSQIGASEIGFNIVGYFMDMVRCPIMYIMPTVEMMEKKTKQTLNPMLEDCPTLKEKVGKTRSRDGGNTLSQKDYIGGTLFLTGANSAASLASVPVRVAVPDEVDRYPYDVDGEGDPVTLVLRRMNTFGMGKKIYMPSTPTNEGESRIWKEFEQTDQQYYYVPCKKCNKLQQLVFEQLRWVPGQYDTVHYACIHCGAEWKNHDKNSFLRDEEMGGTAEWIATRPDLSNPKRMGFHLSALYSPDGWLSWEEIAEEWDKCENDEPKKKAFINTILGLCYKNKGVAPPWQQLMERAQKDGNEANRVWDSVAFITAGADVQPDRIEVHIVGWMKGRVSQVIDYRVYHGDTTKPEVWADLGEVLVEEWSIGGARPLGGARDDNSSAGLTMTGGERRLQIRLMALDANYNSAFVHDFARKWGVKRVIPIQGRDNLEMPYSTPKVTTKTKLGKNLPKGKVWPVGVSYLKTQLYGWLRLEVKEDGVVPNGYVHFLPKDETYFRGLTAEELVPERSKSTNMIKYKWVKRYERNEPLDTMVYALAAAYVVGFDRWSDSRWEAEVKGKGEKAKPKSAVSVSVEEGERPASGDAAAGDRKKKKRGSFWDR